MRILYLCHRLPYPPTKGEKIRALHQLEALGREHEVDLFTLADDPADLLHRSTLLRHCRTVYAAALNRTGARLRALPYLLTKTPLTVPCFRSPALQREIKAALGKRSYDRLFVYSSSMAQYVEEVKGLPVLMDLVDVDSNKWLQYAAYTPLPFSLLYRREAACLRNVEAEICERAACVIVTTEREAGLARELCAGSNVHVVANGVDAERFNIRRTDLQSSNPLLIFTGDLRYFPNADAVAYFACEVLPLVRRRVESARFVIVGRNPGRKVTRLERRPGVTVTGFVADVRTYLANASVAVAPFRIAAGIQNKILEAMASGLPVAGTSRATQGLSATVARCVEVGDSPEELAGRIVELLREPALARKKGITARERVVAEYDWRRHLARLLSLVRDPSGATLENSGNGTTPGLSQRVESKLLSTESGESTTNATSQ